MRARRKFAAKNEHPLNPKEAILYFDLSFEDSNYEEDASNIEDIEEEDPEHYEELLKYENDSQFSHDQENKALKWLEKTFRAKIENEGHDSYGNLICAIGITSHKQLKHIDQIVSRHHIGGDDQMETDVRYFVAQGFQFYPLGFDNRSVVYSEESSAKGTIDEWLKDHD